MKPDIIVCWPRSCDYPLWRQFIRDNRDRFQSVIVVFTETYYGDDYRGFIRHSMEDDNCIFIDPVPVTGDQDWRNVSVNLGLNFSLSEWVWFTEQDFLPTSNQFWINIDNLSKGFDVFGYDADGRLHPCCLFIKKGELERTSMDFGVVKDRLDHFGRIQEDLQDRKVNIGHIDPNYCHHMNGLSQNYNLLYKGQVPNFRPEEFKQYLADCLKVRVPIDSRFLALCKMPEALK